MKKVVVLLSIFVLVWVSCGPSMESENKAWQKNVDAVKSLKSEYPVYEKLIDLTLTEATKLWDEAAGISNEDQKLKQLVAANDLLEQGFIGNLRNIKGKIADLRSKKESLLALKANDEQMESRVQSAFVTVDEAIKAADDVIYLKQEDFSVDGAAANVNRAWDGLAHAYKEVEIIIESINKENQALADEKAKKEQEAKDEKLKAEEAVKDVKCEYCGTLNKYDFSKCKECGAPREKK
jgi:hypothetical protein